MIKKRLPQIFNAILSIAGLFIILWYGLTICIPSGSWVNIVDGTSMEPNLKNEQILFTDSTEIEQGDIITAYLPDSAISMYPDLEKTLLVKRVIGLPGDTVEITNNSVFVNGNLLNESYLPQENKIHTYKDGKTTKITLAKDEFYLMGDNREVSFDSRSFGPIKTTDIMYKQSTTLTSHFFINCLKTLGLCICGLGYVFLIDSVFSKFYK